MTLTLAASGGTYVTYLHASSNAVTGPSPQGSFYSVEVQNVTLSGASGTATLVINRANNGSISTLYSASIAVHSGTVVKCVIIPAQRITVFVDGAFVADLGDSSGSWVATGQPGVGMFSAPGGNSISLVQLGAWDPGYPAAVNTAFVDAYALSTSIRLRWQPPLDDGGNGPGIWRYDFSRSGSYLGAYPQPEFVDLGLTPGTTYTYQICATDWDYNSTCTAGIPVTTAAITVLDPRQPGLRANGSY